MRSLYLSLCAFMLLAATPAAGQVRISQIYGAGGNSGALLNSDYVELFNAGTTSESIGGYSIQYASSTGSSWSRANIASGTIPAGGYFLLRVTAAGATGGAITPDLDISGTIAMSGSAGKVALVTNQTTITSGTLCPTGSVIADFVPYGITTGTGNCPNQTPTVSSTLAAFRLNNGCTDTDNAANDFNVATPAPRNATSGTNPCGGGGSINLSITDVARIEGNSASSTFAFTVALSAPAPAGGVTFDIATADNTATAASGDYVANSLTGQIIAAGSQTFTFNVSVNGDTTIEPNETFFVNITNVTGTNVVVTDAQGQGTIQNDDVTLIPISTIQGSGNASPLVGTIASTSGIVTAVRSNGYFMQTPDAGVDGSAATSEGLFIFTSSTPPAAAAVGNLVQVTGTVTEFTSTGNPAIYTTTQLTLATTLQLSTGNPLPAPVVITPANLTTTGGITQLERYEGMLVSFPSARVVAPTDGSVNEPQATASSNGIFYAVLSTAATPFREAGVEASLPVPTCAAGSGCAIPVWDTNPERIRVDSDGLGIAALNVGTGNTLTNLTGILDHNGSAYTLYPNVLATVGGTPVTTAAIPAVPAGTVSVVAMNLERLFDTVNDPSTSDPVVDPTAYNNRLGKISLAIRNTLRNPDVIALEEVENLTAAGDLASRVNNDTVAAGQPNPSYIPFLVEGNDPGGIDVAFLIKSTVSVVDVTQLEKNTTYTSACTGNQETLNDRPPLRLRGTANKSGQLLDFVVFVNHLRSLNGIDDDTPCTLSTEGARVRGKRAAQANNLAMLIQTELTNNPAAKIIAVGDFNAFEVNDGYVDTINALIGSPAPNTQVAQATNDPTYANLTGVLSFLQPADRYSYVFEGSHQTIDHALLNPAALQQLVGGGYARLNADFPETFRGTFSRPERFSDHDPVFAYFTTATNITAQVAILRLGTTFNFQARTATTRIIVRNTTGSTLSGPLSLVVNGFPDGVTVTNANANNGAAYVFNLTAPLVPGASATVTINLALDSIKAINYNSSVFSGTL